MNSFLIFGGSKGIGRIISSHYSEKNEEITVFARNSRELFELYENYGNRNTVIKAGDISSEKEVTGAFEFHNSTFGKYPTVVINTAAVQGPVGPFKETDTIAMEAALKINIMGSIYIARSALKFFNNATKNSIILFSGGGAVFSRPNFSAYAISKTAILRLVEIISDELAADGKKNIIINAVAPGAVKTRMTDEVISAGNKAGDKDFNETKNTAASGGTSPKLIIRLIDFLSNPSVNKGISGRLIHVRESYIEFAEKYNGNYPADSGKLRRIPLE